MDAKLSCSRAGFLALLFVIARLSAQQTTGAIRGVVTDPTGAAISGVSISATNDQTRITQTTKTNAGGAYVIPLLPPGVYTVSAESTGFAKAVRNNVLVRITETESLDFSVQLGSVTESVTVAASVSLIQGETSGEGRVIEQQTISALPLATRNFTQLLGLTAGVVTDPPNAEQIGFGTQNPSVNGSRRGSNNYLLDGNVNNNPMNNDVAGVGIPSVDFIQEFKVITSMASAEYGRNAGSTVNVVTRAGTNQFHGSLFEFLRNDKLVARPFFATKRGQNIQNQFGGTFGGPVWIPSVYKGRDRTFFFFGWESLRQRNTNSNAAIVTGRVPTPDERRGQFPVPIRDPLTGQPFPGTWCLRRASMRLRRSFSRTTSLCQTSTPRTISFSSSELPSTATNTPFASITSSARAIASWRATSLLGQVPLAHRTGSPALVELWTTTITRQPLPTRIFSARIC